MGELPLAIFRDLFLDSPLPTVLVDAEDGVVIECSQRAARLFGRERAEVIGAPHTEFFLEGFASAAKDADRPDSDAAVGRDPKTLAAEATWHEGRTDSHAPTEAAGGCSSPYVLGAIRTAAGQVLPIWIASKRHIVGERSFLVVTFHSSFGSEGKTEQAASLGEPASGPFCAPLDALPQMVSYIDDQLVYRYANHAYESILGRPVAEVMGQRLVDVIGPEAFLKAKPHIDRCFQGEHVNFSLRLAYPDNSPRMIDGELIPDRAPDGSIRGYWAILTDSTAARETEASQRLSRQQLDALYESTAESFVMIDLEGVVQSFNRVADAANQKHFGMPLETGVHYATLVASEWVPLWEALLEQAAAGERVSLERALPDRFGEEHVYAFVWEPVRGVDGQIQSICCNARDITQRKHAERRLVASEARYRVLVENSLHGVTICDGDDTITYANATFATMLGTTPEGVIGRSLGDFTDPLEFARLRRQSEARRSGQGAQYESRLRAVNGRELTVIFSVAPLFDDDQEFVGALGMVVDITEKAELEKRLQQTQRMEAMGQLAGGIAHDFNNQLAGILGYAELIARRLDDPDQKRQMEHILTAARSSADLTRKLLDFSRGEQGATVPVEIHEVIEQVIGLLERSLNKRIEIVRDLRATRATISACPSQIQNALLNIAINGRDAMPEGGTLRFETRDYEGPPRKARPLPPTGDPELEGADLGASAARFLEIAIRDEGAGMSETVRERIFEPFFTTKPEGEGTGLGLATVYRVIDALGGWVDVESAPGRGTAFRLYLPLGGKPALVVPAPEEDVTLLRGRVLLVDDEPLIRDMVAEMLHEMGLEYTVCRDGQEAMEIYQERWADFDLILLDLMMPRMDGAATFEAMKRINEDAKILVATGYAGSEEQALLAKGALTSLHKPYRVNELNRVLRRYLRPASGFYRPPNLTPSRLP